MIIYQSDFQKIYLEKTECQLLIVKNIEIQKKELFQNLIQSINQQRYIVELIYFVIQIILQHVDFF